MSVTNRLRRDLLNPAGEWFSRPFPALPLELFRMLAGGLLVAHFVRLIRETPAISSPNGLLDHAILQAMYPFTRIGLFQAGFTPDWLLYLCYGVGALAALALAAGWRVRWSALIGLLIAASAYRWNFVVMYLDDAVTHLVLFWFLLLPAGRALTWSEIRRDGWRAALTRATRLEVPGTAVRALLVNVAWIYLIAGAWKYNSFLWREGFGLYASMKVMVGRMPDVWGPEHLPFLRFSNFAVLLSEPFIAMALLFPRGSPVKWLGALAFPVFNLFILATLGIAFAIAGLTTTWVLFMGEEIREAVALRLRFAGEGAEPFGTRGDPPEVRADHGAAAEEGTEGGWHSARARAPRKIDRAGKLSLAFLVVLFAATLRHIPYLGALNEPAYAALWMVGVAQDYRLFNWIDRVNVHMDTRIEVQPLDDAGSAEGPPRIARPGRVDRATGQPPPYPKFFRAKLLQAYGHNVRWLIFPEDHRDEFLLETARRHARWWCSRAVEPQRVRVVSIPNEIEADNLALSANTRALTYVGFSCLDPGSTSPIEGVVYPAEGTGLMTRFELARVWSREAPDRPWRDRPDWVPAAPPAAESGPEPPRSPEEQSP